MIIFNDKLAIFNAQGKVDNEKWIKRNRKSRRYRRGKKTRKRDFEKTRKRDMGQGTDLGKKKNLAFI